MSNLDSLFAEAAEKYGEDKARAAAEASVATYNCNALAGATPEACEAEQAAEFIALLEADE